MMQEQAMEPKTAMSERRVRARTCVGCGLRDDASALLRLVVAEDQVAFDLAGGAFGRGAHLHARAECIAKAPRGLSRSFRRSFSIDGAALGSSLARSCDRRMAGLLLAAHRLHALTVGADASIEAMKQGAPLVVVAVDAGTIAVSFEVARCAAAGRAIAWSMKDTLGALLGEGAIAICAVRHAGIAGELKRMRTIADAGVAATAETNAREGAGCRRPEAR